jgi:hypothetical protein
LNLATNVRLQLTLALASASVNVPDVEPLTSGETRAEERASATQQLCSLLVAVGRPESFFLFSL